MLCFALRNGLESRVERALLRAMIMEREFNYMRICETDNLEFVRNEDEKMQYEQVKELIAIFEQTDLNDMEVQLDNARIRLNRGSVSPWMPAPAAMPAQPAAPAPVMPVVQNIKAEATAEAAQTEKAQPAETTAVGTKVIKAPIVGTFYQSSAPGEAPFVKVGDTVAEGDVVCIIEAMKFMNEVNSEVSGTITEILVEDGQFVEFGQELFRVK